jgi:hypothetical protein
MTCSHSLVRYLGLNLAGQYLRKILESEPQESDPIAGNRSRHIPLPCSLLGPINHVEKIVFHVPCINNVQARSESAGPPFME